MRVVVVRHGQTIWNATGRVQGQANPELSEDGRRQCEQVADRLAGLTIAAIWSSDLVRARGTALAIAARHRGLEVRLDPGLREVDLGRWEGADRNILRRDWPDLYAAWQSRPSWDLVPDGEGSEAFRQRVVSCLGRVAAAAADDQTVVVVTHIGVIRTILSTVVGANPGDLRWPWAIDNTGLTTIQGPPDIALWTTPSLEVIAVNDNAHLRQRSKADPRV